MALDKIASLLRSCDRDESHFPPTELYNEGWLLRLILDWFSTHRVDNHRLSFAEDARWYSEARLRSQFRPRRRQGERLGETHTHADGVIGHFDIGRDGSTDLSLHSDATQFVVLEAKMFSNLSSGVTHASDYDQAARTVACMVEEISQTEPYPKNLSALGFYVLAPADREHKFQEFLNRDSIREKVRRRVAQFRGQKDEWLERSFLHLFPKIDIDFESWEEVIEIIMRHDTDTGREIARFYQRCLDPNALDWSGKTVDNP